MASIICAGNPFASGRKDRTTRSASLVFVSNSSLKFTDLTIFIYLEHFFLHGINLLAAVLQKIHALFIDLKGLFQRNASLLQPPAEGVQFPEGFLQSLFLLDSFPGLLHSSPVFPFFTG